MPWFGIVRHGWSFGAGCGKPDITRVTCKLSALERTGYCIAVADLAARRIDDVRAAFHLADQRFVEHMLGLGVQRQLIVTTSQTFTIDSTRETSGSALFRRSPVAGGGPCNAA